MNTFALTINKQLLIAQLVFIHKDIRIFKQKYLQFEILSDTHVKDPIKSKKQIKLLDCGCLVGSLGLNMQQVYKFTQKYLKHFKAVVWQ